MPCILFIIALQFSVYINYAAANGTQTSRLFRSSLALTSIPFAACVLGIMLCTTCNTLTTRRGSTIIRRIAVITSCFLAIAAGTELTSSFTKTTLAFLFNAPRIFWFSVAPINAIAHVLTILSAILLAAILAGVISRAADITGFVAAARHLAHWRWVFAVLVAFTTVFIEISWELEQLFGLNNLPSDPNIPSPKAEALKNAWVATLNMLPIIRWTLIVAGLLTMSASLVAIIHTLRRTRALMEQERVPGA